MSNFKRRTGETIFLKLTTICYLWILIFGLCYSQPVFCQSDQTQTEERDKKKYPEKHKGHETWEQILSFPGTALIFPFKMLFKGMGKILSVLYVPQKVGALYDFLHSDDGLRYAIPTYSTRGGAGFKIYQKNLINEGSVLKLRATMGLNFRQKYELSFTGIQFLNGSVLTDFHLGYRLLVDESFFGIGPNTTTDDRSTFAQELSWVHLGFDGGFGSRISIKTLLTLEQNNIYKSRNEDNPHTVDLYSKTDIPGLETEVKILGSQFDFVYDSRDMKGGPTSGQEFHLNLGIFTQIQKREYGFWKVKADLRQYIHLFHGRTLALRLAGEMTEPFTNKAVPFYYLSELGRRETIRGFKRGRFRDYDMVLGSVEYYYPIRKTMANTVDAFLFLDAGQVANNIIKDFEFATQQIGFGGGVVVHNKESEALRLMLGRSDEQYRVYLVINY